MNSTEYSTIDGYAVKRVYGGATASQLNHYSHIAINDDKAETIVISGGTNNLTKTNQTPREIAWEMEMVKTCKQNKVKNIYVSSLTCRPLYQQKINQINELLQQYSAMYGYQFIDNSNIKEEHLKLDLVHLNKEGINILANNFLCYLNRNFSLSSIWD